MTTTAKVGFQFVFPDGGPYKDKRRFWFGLRLWIMITLFIVNGALQGSSIEIILVIHHITVMVFILLQALCSEIF